MIEDVKVVRAQIASVAIETVSTKFEMNLGRDEVAMVQKIHLDVDLFVVEQGARIGIYRKSDTVSSNVSQRGEVVEDNNWLTWTTYDSGTAAFATSLAFRDVFDFSPPMVLVRSPRLVVRNQDVETLTVLATIYYSIKKIKATDMTQLLMKYHS